MWFRQDTPREALQHLVSFNNDDGRIDLFGLDPFGSVWHRAELVLGLGWGPWHFLGGPGLQTLVASQNQDGRLELFATRPDSTVWHVWQTSPGGAWSSWVLFFTPADRFNALAVGRNADGRLEVFALAGSGAVWHVWQTAPSNGWSGWAWMDGPSLRTIKIASNADGRLEVFGTGLDNKIWHIWQTAPSNGWSDWTLLFVPADRFKNLAIGINSDGNLEVFAQTPAGALWHTWQGQPFFGWSNWVFRDGPNLATFMLERNSQGILQLFGTDAAGKVWRTSKNSFLGIWSDWTLMFNPADHFREIAVGQDWWGHIQVFAVGMDAGLWQTWEVGEFGGWVGWNLAINIIRVAEENFTPAENADLLRAVEITRTIFADVGIRLLAPSWFRISARDAGGYATLESDSEAKDLVHDWTVPRQGIDVFVVRSMNIGAEGESGLSPKPGPCSKNGKGMDGLVISMNGNASDTGQLLAHEIGHYLGLGHVEFLNLMFPAVLAPFPPPFVELLPSQGDFMKLHCILRSD
jgi:hypothetical protein